MFIITIHLNSNAQVDNTKYRLINDTTNKYSDINEILELSRFKNKVVYVDFWFTSCVHCIKEFKHAAMLKQKFREEPIEFLYLCSRIHKLTDKENAKRWKEIILKYKLEGTHVLMSDVCYSDGFLKKYEDKYVGNIHYINPLYLLVGKQGEIVNLNSPRPSDGQLLWSEIRKELDRK